MNHRNGFTLIELMIVIGILGILTSIAVPNFLTMQHRAKRTEVPTNVDGIKTAELGYEAVYDRFVSVGSTMPRATPDKSPVAWLSGSAFDALGWSPDGDVRGVYLVKTNDTNFKVQGACDVDGDGVQAIYTATRSLAIASLAADDAY